MLKQLCIFMKAKYECLLYHAENSLLSRGKILCPLIGFKNELLTFFQNEGKKYFVKWLQNNDWYVQVTYLVDISDYLNEVNTSIQGKNQNFLTSIVKLTGFKKKISIWKNRIIKKKETSRHVSFT